MQYSVYLDVTVEETPRPFYIGKGKAGRVKDPKRNAYHQRIAAKYGMLRSVVFETDDEQEALAVEVQLIAELRTFKGGGEGWWGANLTLGGEGISGHKHTDESRRKNSESNKIATAGVKNGMFGKHHSEETRRKIGDNQRGWRHAEDSKKKISDAMKRRGGRPMTEEAKQKLSEACIGRVPWNKGMKGAQASTFKGKHHTDETKEKLAASHRGKTPWNKGMKKAQSKGDAADEHVGLADPVVTLCYPAGEELHEQLLCGIT